MLAGNSLPPRTFLNINVPTGRPKGIRVTVQARRNHVTVVDERTDPRGKPYYWIGPVREDGVAEPGTDLAAINARQVSVTPIYLNLTNVPVLASLKKVFR